ncbi:MAG: hypothetical protein ABMB14_13560 [Myxococcota bacterium]
MPTFDPHPFGCPIGLRVTPTEMPDVVVAVCVKLRDLLHPSIYVIRPSKGQPYPVLFLHRDPHDHAPRVVLFPGWEDDRRPSGRVIDYGRQITLLERIAGAGVAGESLESYRGSASRPSNAPGPVLLPLAGEPGEVDLVLHDLHEHLGDTLRNTITRVPSGLPAGDAPLVRSYVHAGEVRPRVVWYPAWAAETDDRIDPRRVDQLIARAAMRSEVPAEVLFR